MLAVIGCCVSTVGGTALAADRAALPDAKPSLWIITLGGYGIIEPKSEGSKSFQTTGRPVFNVRHSTDREWLSLPNDSIDYELIETDQLRAGPVVNARLGSVGPASERGSRTVSIGGHAIAASFEAGAFVEYWPVEWLRTRVEVRAAAIGGSGVVGDLNVDAVWRPSKALTVNAGPRLSVADGAYMDTYYGVSM
jgi:MipA family protein